MSVSFEVLSPPVKAPMSGSPLPVLIHIPHSSIEIPSPWREGLALDDRGLADELLAMTDHYVDELFSGPIARTCTRFVNRLSRLIVDPERFEDDAREPMAAKGMGAVYTRTHAGEALRGSEFSEAQREELLARLFRPYAAAFEREVASAAERSGTCLIIDAHSFPSRPLPFEDHGLDRPDICLGYEPFHCPEALLEDLERASAAAGWRVTRNAPFSGSYVPLRYHKQDPSVMSVMIEVNRGRYMNEGTGERSAHFAEVREFIESLLHHAVVFSHQQTRDANIEEGDDHVRTRS
jgi:N-formylglutamate deformylase